ncbi:TPA: glycosyltransferase family 2 protein [Vibrio parahaemolyticus]|nr:glycosyltransferase family 2 protein [Vibrio parahaemolyticus]HCG7365708.1 glycosyltransferase family 2 protein [Vibrio parahaemolyticus]
MKPKISVVIPYYNDSSRIEHCLLSVFSQTLRPQEIIVIDDCSDDSIVLMDIVNKFDSNLIKIVVIKNSENKNGAYSRNLGVSISSCDYIAFLDADDYWLQEHLRYHYEGMVGSGCDFIYSNVLNDRGKGKFSERKPASTNIDNKYDSILISAPQTNSFFFKKDIYKYVKFDEGLRRHQDVQFFVDVLSSGVKYKYIDVSTAVYTRSHREVKNRYNFDSMFTFWDKYSCKFSHDKFSRNIKKVYLSMLLFAPEERDEIIDKFPYLLNSIKSLDVFLFKNMYLFKFKLLLRLYLKFYHLFDLKG